MPHNLSTYIKQKRANKYLNTLEEWIEVGK